MRANDVASAIIERCPAPTQMQLQKLLYYAQAWHLAITDSPLFDEKLKAWRDGPVVAEVWHERQSYASRVPDRSEPVELDPTASAILDLVCQTYGSRSGDELSDLTHSERPWIDAREGVPDGEKGRRPIDERTMAAYYRAHRKLDGRTAADLAAIGVFSRDASVDDHFDVDELLAEFDRSNPSYIERNVVEVNGQPFPDDVSLDGIRTARDVG